MLNYYTNNTQTDKEKYQRCLSPNEQPEKTDEKKCERKLNEYSSKQRPTGITGM